MTTPSQFTAEAWPAFHKRIPVGTPCYFTDQHHCIHRAKVAGGKQVVLVTRFSDKYEIHNLCIYLDDSPKDLTYHLESDLNYYLDGRWMPYKEAMTREP